MESHALDVKMIFCEALERPAGPDRLAFLERACFDNPALLAQVEKLLCAHERASGFLVSSSGAASPAAGTEPEKDPTNAAADSGDAPATPFERPIALGPGSRIGPYKLLQEIGQGGMGAVFMAEQDKPVRRRVALKVIKAGMDTAQVVARFEAERQALALMDHPNIAKVFDAGTTDTRRPFFAMELVKGIPITQYCDQGRLSPKERLELFISVCHAIQHAHQKGIIHRDIKPSNVLVTLIDAKPVPKVIDFGVAKAIDQRLTEKTLFTQFGSIVGTLEYMSPEQAEFSGMDVDTRSDVYALGVLLYELLTGTTPLEHERLRDTAYAEILRRIKEEEPPKPSTRLSLSCERLASIAAVRGTEPVRLTRAVRGDLDSIVMKAIDKSRTRRYESAGSFARDVQRYLDGDTVEACPPSAVYRLRKFASKHRGPVAIALAFAGLVVAGAGISIAMAVRATQAERETRQERNRAVIAEAEAKAEGEKSRRSALQSDTVLRFLQEQVLAAARPEGEEGGLGREVTIREAVDAAAPKVTEAFNDQPTVEAGIRGALGVTYLLLGEPGRAIAELERSNQLFEAQLGRDHPTTLETRHSLAEAYHAAGRTAEAISLHQATLKACESQLGPDHPQSLILRGSLARAYQTVGRTAEAIKLNEANLKACESRLGADHRSTLAIRTNLAAGYLSAGRTADAIRLYEATLKACEAKLGVDHPGTLSVRANLANAYESAGRVGAAIVLHEETLRARESKLGNDHPITLVSRVSLASRYRSGGRITEAITLYESTCEKLDSKLGTDHPTALACHGGLADAYLSAGRTTEAIKEYEATFKALERTFGPEAANTLANRGSLGAAYLAAGRSAEAIKLYEATIKAQDSKLGPDHPITLACRSNLAGAYQSAGRTALAIELYEATIKACESKLGLDHPGTLRCRNGLAVAYKSAGRIGDAIKLYEATLIALESKLGPDHPDTVTTRNNLAVAYKFAGRSDDEIKLYEAALAALASRLGPGHSDTLNMRNNLADLYQAAGRTAEAVKMLEVLEANLGPDRPDTRMTRLGLMRHYHQLGLFERALPLYLQQYRSCLGEHGPRHIDTIIAMRDLAEIYACLRRYDEAEPLFLASLAGLEDRPKTDPIVVLTEHYLVHMYEAQGRHAHAEPLLRGGLERAREDFGSADPRTAGPMAQLGLSLLQQHKWFAAEPILRECLAIREKAQPDDWLTFNTRSMLGASLAGQDKYAAAEPLIVSGYEGMKAREITIPVTEKPRLVAAANRIVHLYEAWGKKDAEAEWRNSLGLHHRPAKPCMP